MELHKFTLQGVYSCVVTRTPRTVLCDKTGGVKKYVEEAYVTIHSEQEACESVLTFPSVYLLSQKQMAGECKQ
jgi:hypothetical protein